MSPIAQVLISYFSEGDKSITQSASDTLSGKPGEKGIVEQVQEGAGAAYKYAADTATGTSALSRFPLTMIQAHGQQRARSDSL